MKEQDGIPRISLKTSKGHLESSQRPSKHPHDHKKDESHHHDSRSSSSEGRDRSHSKDSQKKKTSRKNSGEELRMTEDKPRAPKSTHSHSGDEEIDESLYIDVPVEAFLLKKNFDYILVDKEDIVEYTGKSETKINQVLKVPYHGTLQLVSHFISQMYADSRLDMKSDEEAVIINEEIFITKNDLENFLIFKWVASQKNDIIADCLAYLFSQFPENRDFDVFNIDKPKQAKEIEFDSIQKKVIKRILNTFHGCTYKIDRHYLIFKDSHCQFTINLKTGKVESKDEAVGQRARSIIANLF
jgi:hypothetical protein